MTDPTPPRVLILLAHPAIHRSRVNRQLAQAVRDLPGITFHDLYHAYPDYDIDVAREQALLSAHPYVVWQFPFYWYSTPALLKEWQDLVLEFKWAYGPGGDALRGKLLLPAMTTGGPEDAYRPDGFNRHTLAELMAPLRQTAHLCGMTMLPPFVVHGANHLAQAEIHACAQAWRSTVEALRDGKILPDAVAGRARLNAE